MILNTEISNFSSLYEKCSSKLQSSPLVPWFSQIQLYCTHAVSLFCIMKIDASFKWTGNTHCLSLNVFQDEFVETINIHGWISLHYQEQNLTCVLIYLISVLLIYWYSALEKNPQFYISDLSSNSHFFLLSHGVNSFINQNLGCNFFF